MSLNISSTDVVSSLRIKLPNVAKDGTFISSSRYINLISVLQSFSSYLKELMPRSINANSITLSNFTESHLGRPVLQPSSTKYFLRSMWSITSQKVYTGSEISIILSKSSGNFNYFGVE